VVVVIAVTVASDWSPGDVRGTLMPIAAGAGIGLCVLAVKRFPLFLALVVAIRASLDAAKLTSSSVDATGALSVLFIGASALWLYQHRRELVERSVVAELLPPFCAFFAVGILSIAFSAHPLESALEAVRIGTVVVIVVALSRVVRDVKNLRVFLFAIFGSAIFPLTVAAVQLARGQGGITRDGISRINGTFVHPNPFAAYLFLIIVLGVAVFPHLATRWRWVLGALVFACGAVLVSTYARGAWIATLIGLVVVAALQTRRLLWVIGVAIVAIAISVPSVGIRLADLSESRSESGAPANSLSWRIRYWDQALALQDNPLLGIGLREVEATLEEGKEPHNDFVRIYVETGLLGLAAYLWLLSALFMKALRTLREAAVGLPRGLAVAFLGTLAGLVVLSISANVVSQLVILWYFGAIVVIACAAPRLSARSAPAAG
jgi:O-antigen ligase